MYKDIKHFEFYKFDTTAVNPYPDVKLMINTVSGGLHEDCHTSTSTFKRHIIRNVTQFLESPPLVLFGISNRNHLKKNKYI
jgi:hypothetical protein